MICSFAGFDGPGKTRVDSFQIRPRCLPSVPRGGVRAGWGLPAPSIPDWCEVGFSHEIADPVPARAAGFTATCCPASRAGPNDARQAGHGDACPAVDACLAGEGRSQPSGKGEARERSCRCLRRERLVRHRCQTSRVVCNGGQVRERQSQALARGALDGRREWPAGTFAGARPDALTCRPRGATVGLPGGHGLARWIGQADRGPSRRPQVDCPIGHTAADATDVPQMHVR